MNNGIQGTYYGFASASAGSATDLIAIAKANTGDEIMAKRLEIYSSGSLAFQINGGPVSTLFKDGTGYYHLLLTDGDVYAKSLTISETTACPVFLSLVY